MPSFVLPTAPLKKGPESTSEAAQHLAARALGPVPTFGYTMRKVSPQPEGDIGDLVSVGGRADKPTWFKRGLDHRIAWLVTL